MKILGKLLIILLVFNSCSPIKELGGETYKYKSKRRTLEIIFANDSICKLKNTFHCTDIDPNIREWTIYCNYEKKSDTLYLRNTDCGDHNCIHDLFVSLPPQKSKQCSYLNLESRAINNTIGPRYQTNYEKFGLIPNIDIDTLYIVKNKIVFTKHNRERILWFVFK